MLIKRLTLLVSMCAFFLMQAQQLLPGEKRAYWFHALSTIDGLSNSNITYLTEDSKGCIWIGTESGANVYDGYTVRMLPLSKDLGISASDAVHSIQEDYLGNIWVNYNGGYVVTLELNSSQSAKEYLNSLGIPMSEQAYVHIDERGSIWCLDTESLYYLNLKNNRKYQFESQVEFTYHNDLYVTAKDENLYITQNEKIMHFDMKTRSWSLLETPSELASSGERIKIYIDQDNNRWVYSLQSELLYRQKEGENTWKKITLPVGKDGYVKNQLRDIATSQSGKIWIATDHKGIFILNEDLSIYKNLLSGNYTHEALASDNVACLLRDHRGAMWLGHYKKGVSITHPSFGLFDNHEGAYRDVSAMLSASDGTIWLGSDGFGLYSEKDHVVTKEPIPNTIVSSIVEDKDGSIWIGTYGEGIYNLKNKTAKKYSADNGALFHNNAWHIAQDDEGIIWYLSGWNNLAYFDPKTGQSKEYRTSKDEPVTGDLIIYDQPSKNIYVGTYWGLCEIEPNGQEHMYYGTDNENQEFLSMQISALAIDRKNDIWWLGHPTGMSIWDKKNDHMYYLNKDLGLCDNKIMQIVAVEEDGAAWVSTTNGLMLIKTIQQGNGPITFAIEPYSTSEGLMDNYFNAASTVDKDKHVYFGSASGYVNINLEQFVADSEQNLAPKVISCSVNGGLIPVSNLRNLNHTDHDIEINFFTKEILDAHSVKYTYMMEGMNDSWIYTRDPKIYFLSLQPGEYKLNVRACGLDGVWGPSTVIPITVEAPLSEKLWVKILFNVGSILLFVILISIFVWRYRARLRRMHEDFEEDSTERVIDLKLQFFGNLNSDLRKPVKKILTKVDRIIKGEYTEEEIPAALNDVKAESKKLDQNLSTLLDFRNLETGGEYLAVSEFNFVDLAKEVYDHYEQASLDKKIRYSFNADADSIIMVSDKNKLCRILHHLLSNAFKNSSIKGKIELNIKHDNSKVQIELADTGRGIPEEEKPHIFKRFFQSQEQFMHTGSGIGLTLVWKYVKMHKGTITFRENEPRGTVFSVVLPLVTDTKNEDSIIEDLTHGNIFDIKNSAEV